MTDLWAQVGIPAMVAAAITLLVEYAAKPTLEARKDRILDRHRTRRMALSHVYAARAHIAYLRGMDPSGDDADISQKLEQEGARLREAFGQDSSALLDSIAALTAQRDLVQIILLSRLAASLRGAFLSDRLHHEMELIDGDELFDHTIRVLSSRPWTPTGWYARRSAKHWNDTHRVEDLLA